MGVQSSRYKTFGELNKHVLKPAVLEVNALAPFDIAIQPVKQGKRVVQLNVGWWAKEATALNDAWKELQASKVGRKARIAGTADHVVSPLPSIERLLRQVRLDPPKTS